jgi:hypothetical protein
LSNQHGQQQLKLDHSCSWDNPFTFFEKLILDPILKVFRE